MKNLRIFFACLFMLMASVVTGQLTNSLEEYYKFNESSGQAANSVNGGINPSSSVSATLGVFGKLGTAYEFNGSTNRVTFADHANWSISTTSSLSVSMWIYFTADITNSYATLWGHQNGPMFYLLKTIPGTYCLMWWAGNAEIGTPPLSYSLNTWYHVVMVKSGTSVAFYRNGTNVGSGTASDVNTDPPALYIGGDSYSSPTQAFKGRIDEVGVWKRALTSTEVSQLYNSGNGLTLPMIPTVATTSASNVGSTGATSGGTVTDNGGSSVSARGVCWSTAANPTITNSKTTDGSGTGAFTSTISGLSANTTYHIRAYATNGVGTAYGSDITFITLPAPVAPSVTTTVATGVTTNSAASGGNVTADGGSPVTARGVCWATTNPPTIANSKTANGTGTGSFTSSITGLNASTRYYYRAYATTAVGTNYGNTYDFTTGAAPVVPTVSATTTPGSITQNTAVSGGTIASDGGAPVTQRGVCWSTTVNPTIANSKTTDGSGTGTFASSLTGLSANTLYHVRAYATNSVGTGYGPDMQFTTPPIPVAPTLTTQDAAQIMQSTARVGGQITSNGGAAVTEKGVCYATTNNPTVANNKTIDSSTPGSDILIDLSGLAASTTYYYRTYAINSSGTGYGPVKSFTTVAAATTTWRNNGTNLYYTDGKVSIGTPVANGASALTVNGKILATEVEVVSNITSDYVFEAEYELMPLTELELFLRNNKHLPGIPSAAEFSQTGQNLGKMDDLLLRKIEELTLYILRQQTEIEQLKKALEKQQK